MRQAFWVECDPPSAEVRKDMVHLCELVTANENDLEGVIDLYVHPTGIFAMSCRDGVKWSTADLRSRRRDDPR